VLSGRLETADLLRVPPDLQPLQPLQALQPHGGSDDSEGTEEENAQREEEEDGAAEEEDEGKAAWALGGSVQYLYQVFYAAACLGRARFAALDLSGNFLADDEEGLLVLVRALRAQRGLAELNLSRNRDRAGLRGFSQALCGELALTLRALPRLRVLKLADNGIARRGAAAVMCAVVRLERLRQLDLRANRFEFLPLALPACCPELVRVEVSKNPWLLPPPKLVTDNAFRLKEVLADAAAAAQHDRALGLFFLGREEVGKTRLLRALTDPLENGGASHVPLDERTCGIAFSRWCPSGDNGPDFAVRDLGGVGVYSQAQAQLFLQRRAVYCLVWRPFPRYSLCTRLRTHPLPPRPSSGARSRGTPRASAPAYAPTHSRPAPRTEGGARPRTPAASAKLRVLASAAARRTRARERERR